LKESIWSNIRYYLGLTITHVSSLKDEEFFEKGTF